MVLVPNCKDATVPRQSPTSVAELTAFSTARCKPAACKQEKQNFGGLDTVCTKLGEALARQPIHAKGYLPLEIRRRSFSQVKKSLCLKGTEGFWKLMKALKDSGRQAGFHKHAVVPVLPSGDLAPGHLQCYKANANTSTLSDTLCTDTVGCQWALQHRLFASGSLHCRFVSRGSKVSTRTLRRQPADVGESCLDQSGLLAAPVFSHSFSQTGQCADGAGHLHYQLFPATAVRLGGGPRARKGHVGSSPGS